MDPIDKFLKLYSYKFPKGHIDINDPQDVLLLENILQKKLGFKFKLREQDDYSDSIYVDELDVIKKKVEDKKPEGYELSHLKKNSNKVFQFYFKDVSPRSRNIRSKIASEISSIFPDSNIEILPVTPNKGPRFIMDVGGDRITFEIKGAGGKFDTTTTQKEGLVIFFYNSPIDELFTSESLAKSFNTFYENKDKYLKGLDSGARSSVIKLLDAYNGDIEAASKIKSALVTLNDPLSAAIAIKNTYPSKKLIRDGLFDTVRKEGSALAEISEADKWNPGDVYLQLTKGLQYTVSDAENSPETIKPITTYNKNFVNIWGETTNIDDKPATFVSISLKQESAQAGKGKGYLKGFDPQQIEGKIKGATYNLSDEEKQWDEKQLNDEIDILKSTILGQLSGEKNIEYDPDLNPKEKERLISKYASLKLLSFIVIQVAKSAGIGVAKALAAVASYAASLTGVNPTFFKVTGNPAGEASIVRFPGESSAELKGDSDIIINDKMTNGSILIDITITMLDPKTNQNIDKSYTMNIRSNGTGQNTIELSPKK
jgi:hypothetical protein